MPLGTGMQKWLQGDLSSWKPDFLLLLPGCWLCSLLGGKTLNVMAHSDTAYIWQMYQGRCLSQDIDFAYNRDPECPEDLSSCFEAFKHGMVVKDSPVPAEAGVVLNIDRGPLDSRIHSLEVAQVSCLNKKSLDTFSVEFDHNVAEYWKLFTKSLLSDISLFLSGA